jgi:hypothetical protein
MATASEILPLEGPPAVSSATQTRRTGATSSSEAVMNAWIAAQSINLTRHAAALQPRNALRGTHSGGEFADYNSAPRTSADV